MARTEITVQELGAYGKGSLNDLAFVAADPTNGNQFENTGKEIVLCRNNTAASNTLTAASVPCSHGFTGDKVITTGGSADDHGAVGPLPTTLFNQGSGTKAHLDASSANLEIAIFRFTDRL